MKVVAVVVVRLFVSLLLMLVRIRAQEVTHLQETVHQECAERTVILEQLNSLRHDASLPPLPLADVRRLAMEYVSKHRPSDSAAVGAHATPTSPPPMFPPLGRRGSQSQAQGGAAGALVRRGSSSSLTDRERELDRASAAGDGDDAAAERDDEGGAAAQWLASGRGRGLARGRGRGRPAR
jgi:hypothetical protein